MASARRPHGGNATRAPLTTEAVEAAERAIGEAAASGLLPALPDRAGKSLGANDLMHFTDRKEPSDGPWYRLAYGRSFAGYIGGEPHWEPTVRLIAPQPPAAAPLKDALAKLGVHVGAVPWIGVPRLQVSARKLARQAAEVLEIGHSIRHAQSEDGTITLFFKVNGQNGHYLMTSGHVATSLGKGRSGDHLSRVTAAAQGQTHNRAVAVLAAAPAGPPGNAFPQELIPVQADYAIAKLLEGVVHRHGSLLGRKGGQAALAAVGPVPVPGVNLQPRVSKIGVGSGETSGVISAVEVRIDILDPISGLFLRYEDQIEITPESGGVFSKEGDSGALVFTDDLTGVAMVNAGTSKVKQGGRGTTALTFCSRLEPILIALGASVQL